jgi:hypothetical protein
MVRISVLLEFTTDVIPTSPLLQLSKFSHITPTSPHLRVPLILFLPTLSRLSRGSTIREHKYAKLRSPFGFSKMYTVGNIYVIAAVAVIGGGLFGFDIASMSAIISTEPYLCYFK